MGLYLDLVVSLSLILFEMRLEDGLLDKNLFIDYGTLLGLAQRVLMNPAPSVRRGLVPAERR